jgi:hypothetical protein
MRTRTALRRAGRQEGSRHMHARRVRFVVLHNLCQTLLRGVRVPFRPGACVSRAVVPGVLCLLVAAGGCQQTRLPVLVPSPYDADKRSFNVHDPLPETNIGPDTGARPPGFMQERSEPRRTTDAEALLGIPPGGTNNGQPPSAPMGAPLGAPMVAPPGAPIGPSSQLYPDAVPR